MHFSFIIPALDEERNIGRVLNQFRSLKRENFEVIVADGGSIDDTVRIARKFGAIIVQNKRETQNIAKNRNLGAKVAKGDILVFCDADTCFEDVDSFILEVEKTFKKEKVVGGMLKIRAFPEESKLSDNVFHSLYNLFLKLSFFIKLPFSSGQCQIVKKNSFLEVGGYNEYFIHGEDTYLFRKLGNIGKLHHFSNLVIYESTRRYRKIGYIRLIIMACSSITAQFFGKNLLKGWFRVD